MYNQVIVNNKNKWKKKFEMLQHYEQTQANTSIKLGHRNENPTMPKLPEPENQPHQSVIKKTTMNELFNKCLNLCVKSNDLRICNYLCLPIKSILSQVTQEGSEELKVQALQQAKHVMKRIKDLTKAVVKKGEGREEGAPPIPDFIPLGPA